MVQRTLLYKINETFSHIQNENESQKNAQLFQLAYLVWGYLVGINY